MKDDNRGQIDAELVNKTLAGDNQAFTQLIESYYRLFFSIAIRYLHDPGRAEDLVQEGLIDIHKTLDTLKEPHRFSSWAYTIIKRKSGRALKNMKTEESKMRQYSEEEKIRDLQEEKSRDPMESIYLDSRKQEILKAACELPDKYREILVLYYFEQMDIHEIAKRFHINASTADVRLFRAQKKLQAILQGNLS